MSINAPHSDVVRRSERTPHSIAAQVRALRTPYGHLAVWALGQQGYLLKGGGWTLIIDPYLSNYVEETQSPVASGQSPEPNSGDWPLATGDYSGLVRQVPIVIRPDELGMVAMALCSHHHADHCDPHTLLPLLQAAPEARLLTSYSARDALVAAGADPSRMTVPVVDREVDYGEGLTINAIPSAHYGFEPDDEGNPAYLGFIITLNGVRLYHSGDSVIYDGLLDRLKMQPIDVMCLPINGRDYFREQQGIVGNMDCREAAELAAAAGAKVLLPGHYDMFKANSVNPAYLFDYLCIYHPRQRVHFLQAGELYYYVANA